MIFVCKSLYIQVFFFCYLNVFDDLKHTKLESIFNIRVTTATSDRDFRLKQSARKISHLSGDLHLFQLEGAADSGF